MTDTTVTTELSRFGRRLLADPDSIVLAAGSHRSPGYGMCTVEAASLLAGERFSDRPTCVCPVVASFVRALNDRLHHHERQRLRPYVNRIVGSRGDRRSRRERRELLLGQALGRDFAARRPGPLGRLLRRARVGLACGLAGAIRFDEGAGEYAARATMVNRDLDAAMALLDEVLSLGPAGPASPETPASAEMVTGLLESLAYRRWPQPERRSRPSHGRPLHTDHPRRREPEEPAAQRTAKQRSS